MLALLFLDVGQHIAKKNSGLSRFFSFMEFSVIYWIRNNFPFLFYLLLLRAWVLRRRSKERNESYNPWSTDGKLWMKNKILEIDSWKKERIHLDDLQDLMDNEGNLASFSLNGISGTYYKWILRRSLQRTSKLQFLFLNERIASKDIRLTIYLFSLSFLFLGNII